MSDTTTMAERSFRNSSSKKRGVIDVTTTIKGTIYIAPGNTSCRVYAMPYRMRPGQSPRDLLGHHQREWTFIGQLDSDLEIVCLELPFQHLAADIEGQMGGTHFPAEWQVH